MRALLCAVDATMTLCRAGRGPAGGRAAAAAGTAGRLAAADAGGFLAPPPGSVAGNSWENQEICQKKY